MGINTETDSVITVGIITEEIIWHFQILRQILYINHLARINIPDFSHSDNTFEN